MADDTFGGRLRAARERAGLTVYALAKATRVGQSSITRIEAGREPLLRTAQLLALALGVPLDELLPPAELPEPRRPKPKGRPRKM
jgi:transcriptional regulator with XRE-family HTH domain